MDHFNLTLGGNELVGLIGPNGAGKTTIFNALTGVYTPTEGDVLIGGESILGKSTHQVVAMGAARTFQNIRLFKDLTTIENVEIAYNNFIDYNLLDGFFRLPKFWKGEKKAYQESMKLLEIFDMGEYAQTKAKGPRPRHRRF